MENLHFRLKASSLFLGLSAVLLVSCQFVNTNQSPPSPTPAETAMSQPINGTEPPLGTSPITPSPWPTSILSPQPFVSPTTTSIVANLVATQTPIPTMGMVPMPTATPIGPCSERVPPDDLLTIVTLQYSLSRHYAPQDLVPLSDHLPVEITLGYETEIRKVVARPLLNMVRDMQAAGLTPLIVSGYRSYSTQALAWYKWQTQEPNRASQLSAPPGYSEHQLGTTVDFSSPELAELVGDETVQFHTSFYLTREGEWLTDNAHKYGFTLSYSREAFELTGFYYEPWHFRYVGIELATMLYEKNATLTAYQLATQPIPCIPD